LLFKFYDEVKVLYDQASVFKSSITMDTAFRKDLTLQGAQLYPHVTTVPWSLARSLSGVMAAYNLYLTSTYSMSHAKRF
jgi:hypothetical protein